MTGTPLALLPDFETSAFGGGVAKMQSIARLEIGGGDPNPSVCQGAAASELRIPPLQCRARRRRAVLLLAAAIGTAALVDGARAQGTDGAQQLLPASGLSQVEPHSGLVSVTFPIEVPPGRHGMQPVLALGYSSGAGIGPAGYGFSFDVGSIRRSTRWGPPRFDNSDTFTLTLGGQSYDLVPIDADSTRFRTDIDSGFLIERVVPGPFGPGSSYWVARGRDGRFYRFGYVGDAPSVLGSQVPNLSWGLDRIEDSSGNVLEIQHSIIGNRLYPTRIDYASHPATGLPATNAVELCWERRGDQAPRLWGERFVYRLSAISTRAAGRLARRYSFVYRTPTDFNRIGICPAAQLPGETGSTDGGNTGRGQNRLPVRRPARIRRLQQGSSSLSSTSLSSSSTISLDPLPPSPSHLIRILRHDGNGSTLPPISYVYRVDAEIAWSDPVPGGEPPLPFVHTLSTEDADSGVRLQDINRDGLPDLLRLSGRLTGGRPEIIHAAYLNTGGGFEYDAAWSESLLNLVDPFDQTRSSFFVLQRGNRRRIDNGVRFLDVNDDGYQDIVRITSYFGLGTRKAVHLNTGSGFTANVSDAHPLPDEPFVIMREVNDEDVSEDIGVRIVDVNGDGRADLVRSRAHNGAAADRRVYLFEDGLYVPDPTWILPDEPFVRTFGGGFWLDVGVRFMHLDRDGYIDLFRAANVNGMVSTAAYLHTRGPGHPGPTWEKSDRNWWLTVTGERFVDVTTSNGGISYDRGLRVADINADGVSDIVLARSWNGGSPEKRLFSPLPAGGWTYRFLSDFPGLFIVKPPDGIPRDQGVRLVDVDGDGGTDYLASPESGTREWRPNTAWLGRALLVAHSNGIGGMSRIEYTPAPHGGRIEDGSRSALPFPLPVVSSHTVSDGLGHAYTTRYEYAGGFYHHRSRDFRGFHTVTVTEPGEGLSILTRYFQRPQWPASPLKGRPIERVLRRTSDRAVFSRTRWSYDTGDAIPPQFEWLTDDPQSASPVRRTATSYSYDYEEGLFPDRPLVRRTERQEGDVGDPDDDRIIVEDYSWALDGGAAAGPQAGRWFLDLPFHTTLSGADGMVVAESWTIYDDRPLGEIGARGLPTSEERRGGPIGPAGARSPGDPANSVTSRAYDVYGNVILETDPMGRIKRIEHGLADPSHTFPEMETDPLGGVTLRGFDPRTGLLEMAVDVNGRAAHIVSDGFGRRLAEHGPYDSAERPTVSYVHDYDTMPARIFRYARESSGLGQSAGTHGTIESIALFDGLGRLLETKTESTDGTMIVSGAVTFDAAGRIATEAEPFRVAYGPAYVSPSAASHLKRFEYDAAGRRTAVINAVGETRRVQRMGGRSTLVDPLGHRRDVHHDAFGNVIRVEEYEGDAGSWTLGSSAAYRYDAADRLRHAVDPSGTTLAISFDALGRRTGLTDAHIGSWSYDYDPAGNLIAETDPLGRETSMEYDRLDRLVSKRTGDGTRIRWNYDEGGAATNALGRLTSIEDLTGVQWFAYDRLGRVIETSRLLEGTVYTVRTSYDALSRVTASDLPSGGSIRYEYDAGGNLSAALPFAKSLQYDARGQLIRTVRQNDLVVDRSYDGAGRPSQIRAAGPTGELILHLSYGFLADGLISTITDLTDASEPKIESFFYDGRHRLIGAAGSGGQRSYAYDDAGSLLLKNGVGFFYDDPFHPQWLTRTSAGLSLSYDPMGNVTRILGAGSDRSMTYDGSGRMTSLSDPENDLIVRNDYDANGQRVRQVSERAGASSVLLTPMPQVEVRDGAMTLHYFAGSLRLASVDPERGPLYPIVDHLGSARVVVGGDGQSIARYGYAPYGSLQSPATEEPVVSHLFAAGFNQRDTGLILMGDRYYDPDLGRFLQPDPLVGDLDDPHALNRYAYARDNPLNLTDPDGRSPLTAFLLIGAIALLDRDTRSDVASSVALTAASILVTGSLGPGFGQGLRALAASTPALYAAAVTPVILNSRLGDAIVQSYAMLFQDLGLSTRNSAVASRILATLMLNSQLQRSFGRALSPRGEAGAGSGPVGGEALDDYLGSRGTNRHALVTPSGEAYGIPIHGGGAGEARLDHHSVLVDSSGEAVGVFGVRELGLSFQHGAIGFFPTQVPDGRAILRRRHLAYGVGGVSTQQFARELFGAGYSGSLFTLTGRASNFLVEFIYGPYGGGLALGVHASSASDDRREGSP
jgi:RHS repeat-associated protein